MFVLEDGLNGKPVKLANGCKGFIICKYPEDFEYPLVGYWIGKDGGKNKCYWDLKGVCSILFKPFNIVDMWDEDK
ncbi:hypothetical protein DDU33_07810 [Actinobacillus porcitonsillarum]|uniref:Uncharacterized protein n=1 Tax=Actinobacillus porcitonsillarum TaxID=189834 RepID=A0A2U8FLQ4_9PAST|nr:hypothetical protein [Actinobacillus porcitonsillarum]AWI51396.1 hypothetical protein DDU33_07810 [Actinobacillus porcitonsillarum]